MSSGIGSGEGSRCASPNVTVYPMSVRQQLALIKQMEQPSPSSSVDGEGGSASVNTPGSSRKRVSRVHKKNDRGETALHVAARRGDDVQCERLIEEGAEVNCADYAGWSALHEAAFHNRFHAAQILIEKGADVNFESADFETPLHDAAAKGFVKIVWLLLKHGADRAKKNKDGKRPIDLVDEEEHPRVYSLLTTNTLPTECPSGAPSSPERGESIGRGGYDSGNETPNAGSSTHAQAPPPVSAPLPLPIPPSSSIATSIPSTAPFVPSISLTPPTEAIHIPEQKPTEPEQVVSAPADVPIPVPAPSQVPSLPPEVPISVDTTDPLLAMDTGSAQPTPTGAISEPLLTKSEPLIIQTPTTSVDICLQNTSSEAETVEAVKEEKKPSSQPSTPTIRIKFSTPSLNDESKDKEKQSQIQSNSDSAPASTKGSPEEKMEVDEVKTEQKDQQGTDVKALTATVNISPITVGPEETRRDSSASASGASTELFESEPLKTMKLNRQMEEEEGIIEGDIGEQKQNVEDETEEYEDDEMSKDSSSQMNIPSVSSMNALLKQGEEGDECSDDVVTAVRKQKLGLPRGRGARGRPSSRSSTPMSTSGERMVARKTVGRGRGSKRGRGNLNYGTRHLEAISFVNAPSSTATDDVFEFRGSPDGLEEDEVLTRPPSPKRAKTERETSSAAGSNSGEADDMNEETGDEDRMKKVPPLRILLPKTPSEEDPEEPRRTRMGIRSGKGGSGLGISRTGAETQGGQTQEDDKRITRSKVRRVKQGGKVMDDFEGGLMTKKKRREKAESDHTRESSVLATIDEGSGEMSTSMMKIELKEEVVEEENRVGHEILQQNPSTGALSMKRMLANRWLHDLENQQKLPKTSEESRFKNFSIFSGNYKSGRRNKGRSRSVLSDENKTSWPYEIMSDVHKKQRKARRELRQRMAGERIRLRLSFEEDLIRLSRRRNGTTPLMSFARMHAESEICNPLFLDEPPENINLSYSDLALKKQRSRLLGEIHKRSTALYKRHRMEAESLQILQKNIWNLEAAKRHISLTEELVKQCVPRVKVRKIVIRRPSLAQNMKGTNKGGRKKTISTASSH